VSELLPDGVVPDDLLPDDLLPDDALHDDALHDDAVRLLTDWVEPPHGEQLERDQQSLAQAYLSFLAARADGIWRSCVPGHLTASALVISADRSRVLLTLHPRVGRWLQLGGHLERGDATVAGAALREATEESGIAGLVLDPVPVRLDVHPITCSLGLPTRHLDVQFRASAPPGASVRISHESDDLAWHPVERLPPATDDSLRALVRAATRR
jgi:8-oxo-dGTP pyrophosphatase MutT (NUDIX family)